MPNLVNCPIHPEIISDSHPAYLEVFEQLVSSFSVTINQMEAVEGRIHPHFEKITRILNQDSPGKDPRLLARAAEELAAALNTYSVSGIENLPQNPPFIVAANHDVIRGRVTKFP